MPPTGQITATYPPSNGEGGVSQIVDGPGGALWVDAYPFVEHVSSQGDTTQVLAGSVTSMESRLSGPNCTLTKATFKATLSRQTLWTAPVGVNQPFTFGPDVNIWAATQQTQAGGVADGIVRTYVP